MDIGPSPKTDVLVIIIIIIVVVIDEEKTGAPGGRLTQQY